MTLYQNRIVVKVGTSTLTNRIGKIDLKSFDQLACVLSDVQNMGFETEPLPAKAGRFGWAAEAA